MNRRSIRDMEARQQCFQGECEIRQLKKEMRRDKIQLKELEQENTLLKSKRKLKLSKFVFSYYICFLKYLMVQNNFHLLNYYALT